MTKDIRKGDVVYDSWGVGIDKATVVDVRHSWWWGTTYYVSFGEYGGGYLSPYPRRAKHLELAEKAEDIKRREERRHAEIQALQERRRALEAATQESMRELNRAKRVPGASAWTGAWFDVVLKQDFAIGGFFYLRGSVFQARQVESHVPSHEVRNAQYEIPPEYAIMNDIDFYELFKMKEENAMGGELFGYPPEEPKSNEDNKELERVKAAARQTVAEADAKIAELEEKLAEKEMQYEVARQEKVAETYGIVAERHLWSVVVNVPQRWGGKLVERYNEQKTEVLTEGRDMVEAAMAAEAMAKGMSEDAHVLSIDYVRVIGAIK